MISKAELQSRTFYLDASALVKRYLGENGSAWVESLCADEANNAIAIARFGLVETARHLLPSDAASSSRIASMRPHWTVSCVMQVIAIDS